MQVQKIKKVLIANRGEIALRIIRSCRELDIQSVSIFSTIDANGVWVRKADESILLEGDPIQVYLDYKNIVEVAKRVGADAIHPGYGFLSENPDFAQHCIDNGVIFIGPKPEHIALFGDKMASKNAMRAIGVPVIEGAQEPITDVNEAISIAKKIGFPVIIKAAFGGGGKGIRIVKKEEDFIPMFEAATKEAERFFGRGDAFVEKYLSNPRHIEVQIVADKYGNVIHLAERDCSIQRKHQKVVEIAPSPRLNDSVRRELLRASKKAMIKLGYESVGTIEYLVDEDDNFYFIEMNTRVQVEHTITEAISGVDIIYRMIRIAEGQKLPFMQEDIKFRGYAIEFRINAEDPKNNFIPCSGRITTYLGPGGPGVRMDAIGYKDYVVPTNYDSMIGKLIVTGLDWDAVVRKSRRALDEFIIGGIPTNIPLHREIVRDEDFKEGLFDTTYLDKKLPTFTMDVVQQIEEEEEKHARVAAIAAAISARKK